MSELNYVDMILDSAAQVGLNAKLPPGEKTDMLRSFGGNALLPPALMLKIFLELPSDEQDVINRLSIPEVLAALILMTSHLYAATPEVTENIKNQLVKAEDIKFLHSAILALSLRAVSDDEEVNAVLDNIRQKIHVKDSSN